MESLIEPFEIAMMVSYRLPNCDHCAISPLGRNLSSRVCDGQINRVVGVSSRYTHNPVYLTIADTIESTLNSAIVSYRITLGKI